MAPEIIFIVYEMTTGLCGVTSQWSFLAFSCFLRIFHPLKFGGRFVFFYKFYNYLNILCLDFFSIVDVLSFKKTQMKIQIYIYGITMSIFPKLLDISYS